MKVFLLMRDDEALPLYFTCKPGQALSTWQDSKKDALQFARQQDAENFRDSAIPHLAPILTVTPHEMEPT